MFMRRILRNAPKKRIAFLQHIWERGSVRRLKMAGNQDTRLVTFLLLAFILSTVATQKDSTRDAQNSWTDDFVTWWGYARIPLFTFVMGSFGMTWFFALKYGHTNVNALSDSAIKEEKDGQWLVQVKQLVIFYGSQTGTAKNFATSLSKEMKSAGFGIQLYNMADYDPEDKLVEEVDGKKLFVFIISTYTNGNPPEAAQWFYKYIVESSDDCRVPKELFKGLRFAIFGLGNSLYGDNFNKAAKTLDISLKKLSGSKMFPTGLGDENTASSKEGGIKEDFDSWLSTFKLLMTLGTENSSQSDRNCCDEKEICCKTKDNESEDKASYSRAEEIEEPLYESSTDEGSEDDMSDDVVDLEDLGSIASKLNDAKSQLIAKVGNVRSRRAKRKIQKSDEAVHDEAKEMVTPLIRKNLEKQGYKVVGSHSGVKICRWTKAMLRGRGGCYKHTFYGINSHQCMETTPSLACANKCVFCWRHHTNPVGTEWRWQMNDPDMIVDGAMQNHYNMIKQFRGVPGVLPERFKEGMQIRHCALSLVGEPIMYPRINEMVDLLHSKEISSFLVTNAQFPDAIRDLKPVTQLYVSVDASDKDSLKKIDRPLFRDYWQRFVDSLKALKEKGQRTVYRLTLVKSFNIDEVEGYAKLIEIGNPSFIEVKGVTYCGESKASSLTMQNVPWHQEVIDFVKALQGKVPDYEVASEHEHSNCVLLAHRKFKINDEWHTWIDYPKFHKLVSRYDETGGRETFTDMDYIAATPYWATFGDENRGFDPSETRFYRKKRKDVYGC